MDTSNGLAGFLRARRELLKPADVGLPDSERRRVEGLRREEVAMLAGISTEYYLRLEQGRDHQPSDQVLDGLARALQLDEDAGNYLRALARPAPRRRGRSFLKGLTLLCKLSSTAGHLPLHSLSTGTWGYWRLIAWRERCRTFHPGRKHPARSVSRARNAYALP